MTQPQSAQSPPPLPIPCLPPERAAAGLLRLCAYWFGPAPSCMTGELQRVLAELWAKAENAASAESAFISDVLSPAINAALSAEGSESAEQLLAYAETVPLPHNGEPLSASPSAQPAFCAMQQTISTYSPLPNVPTRKSKRRPAAV